MKIFNSIYEIWLHNWEQLNISGDLRWLIVDQKEQNKKHDLELLENAYFDLQDQYVEETKGNKELISKWRTLIIKRMTARVLYAQGDKSQLNYIEFYTAKIENLMNTSQDVDIIKTRMLIQQRYGQPIKPKETTLAEFIKISEIVSEQKPTENGKTK